MPYQKRALVDFDGVIHAYSKGWHDGTAYDPPMPLAFEGLRVLEDKGYDVVIFSTRPAEQIIPWLDKHGFPRYQVTDQKLPAQFILDDRAVRFTDWDSALDEISERYDN